MQNTIIKVGTTEIDEYGNLLVTPSGGGDKIKIAQKRTHLHHLFEQGNTVALHWETYMNKSYVANANLVEGEPPLVKEAVKEGAKVTSVEKPTEIKPAPLGDAKNRAFALSYAKDLAVAAQSTIGKELSSDNIIALAKKFAKYLDTGE